MSLSQNELLRYGRQLPLFGVDGQNRLKEARVLVVGAGGLGCPVLQYLTAAGVGHISIVDGDHVELSNLQRQILFTEKEIGQNKAMLAKAKLAELNANTTFEAHDTFLDEENAKALIAPHDLVIDGTDNYAARFLLNRFCRELQKPLVSASIYRYEAQISVFNNLDDAPCYECLYPKQPPEGFVPNCAEGGVLGVLPGVVGGIQATEALKLLLNTGESLAGRLLMLDLFTMQFQEFKVTKHPDCQNTHCRPETQTNTTQPQVVNQISPKVLQAHLNENKDLQLIDVREPYEREICHFGGIHIPLSMLPSKLSELSPEKETVIYCKSGKRSEQAVALLTQHQFNNISSLSGGILAWIDETDKTLSRY
jgi:sulfur-carrier protein adenylyltransferase/sulfurtransferase